MNKRLVSVLLFALVVSGAASFFLYKLISSQLASSDSTPTTRLAVASRQLEIGALLKDGDITEVDWAGKAPENVLTKKEEIIGRGVVATIYSGEPIRSDRLAPVGAGAGLAATIPVGKRAVAIRVNDVVSVAGFVTPGQRVDLLIMGQPTTGSAQLGTMSKTLLQNIEVLSAGQQIQKDAEGKPVTVPVVNLLVTPEQAEIVSLASNSATIQMVLRNPLDKEDSKTNGVFLGKLFGANPGAALPVEPSAAARAPRRPAPQPAAPVAAAKPAPPPPPVIVEILHGSAKAQVTFKQEETKSK